MGQEIERKFLVNAARLGALTLGQVLELVREVALGGGRLGPGRLGGRPRRGVA